jgi:DNA mismatch endonuclease (patch repair protein)
LPWRMSDIWSQSKRSQVMSKIRGSDTRPEILLRKALFRLGYRFRANSSALPGRPDIVFVKRRIAVFVQGCFWHGCPIHYSAPEQNAEFWKRKLQMNRSRDERSFRALRASGWKVVLVWEHDVEKRLGPSVSRIARVLGSPSTPKRLQFHARKGKT